MNCIIRDEIVRYKDLIFEFTYEVNTEKNHVEVCTSVSIKSFTRTCAELTTWMKKRMGEYGYDKLEVSYKLPGVFYLETIDKDTNRLNGYRIPQDNNYLPWSAYPMVECQKLRDKCMNLGDSKMSVLLHGKPGTGKSSLIKTLAKETNRHIINIDMVKISNIHRLRELIFGSSYVDILDKHSFSYTPAEVIFVFEEIDGYFDMPAITQKDGEIIPFPKIEEGDFLTLLNGVSNPVGAIIIFTTNFIDKLDRKRMFRAGRIDCEIEMRQYTESEVRERLAANGVVVEFSQSLTIPAELERVINMA